MVLKNNPFTRPARAPRPIVPPTLHGGGGLWVRTGVFSHEKISHRVSSSSCHTREKGKAYSDPMHPARILCPWQGGLPPPCIAHSAVGSVRHAVRSARSARLAPTACREPFVAGQGQGCMGSKALECKERPRRLLMKSKVGGTLERLPSEGSW
jgi:hypothetical protein